MVLERLGANSRILGSSTMLLEISVSMGLAEFRKSYKTLLSLGLPNQLNPVFQLSGKGVGSRTVCSKIIFIYVFTLKGDGPRIKVNEDLSAVHQVCGC